jgi:uncharacterized protein YeeX (DUF496 family)
VVECDPVFDKGVLMQDEIKQNTDKDTYQNPFTESKNQRKKLTLPLHELIKLDNTNQFKITFCCQLAQYIKDTNSLKELRNVLKAVSEYEIVREKDFFITKSAGYFDYKDKQIFFKERPTGILIGFFIESQLICRLEEYKYYSLQAVTEAVKDF